MTEERSLFRVNEKGKLISLEHDKLVEVLGFYYYPGAVSYMLKIWKGRIEKSKNLESIIYTLK